MHSLGGLNESFDQCWSKFNNISFTLTAHQFNNLFNFIDEDDFFGRTCEGPEFKESFDQVNREQHLFFKIILDAYLELRVERLQFFYLVQGYQYLFKKFLVFLSERHTKSRCN